MDRSSCCGSEAHISAHSRVSNGRFRRGPQSGCLSNQSVRSTFRSHSYLMPAISLSTDYSRKDFVTGVSGYHRLMDCKDFSWSRCCRTGDRPVYFEISKVEFLKNVFKEYGDAFEYVVVEDVAKVFHSFTSLQAHLWHQVSKPGCWTNWLRES